MPCNNIPLVLLPGLLNDERLWAHQVAAFEPSRSVFVADLAQDDSIAQMARRTLEQAPPLFALAALSMGGYVAMEIMRQAPERVVALALFDTMVRPDSEDRARVRRGLLELAKLGKFMGVTPHLLPKIIHPRSIGTAAAQQVMDMAQSIGREGFIRQQQAIIEREDYRSLLETISVPTLIVVGENDEITPLEESEFTRQGIAGSRLVIMPECGHLPPLEYPQRTTELLQEWLVGADLSAKRFTQFNTAS
ncbi:alpha/beta hydrolase [Pseudomonas cichorii]|nr:alpha/beta fold hydrolase [Pseudomonas cichorii]MBX8554387.1 alpha/beta hydrolase [Pseudomonas cichorii]MBX8559632.1 alpha/beta hydrolase [Pseudomonas cichorii]MBX8616482.1 alpha/beta hydrolase [Pseudomonas cichorii]